jgi:hypothetical protein
MINELGICTIVLQLTRKFFELKVHQNKTYHNCFYFSLLAAALPCLYLEVFKNVDIWLLPHYQYKHKHTSYIHGIKPKGYNLIA